jgi:glycosyltransferase involved in cell wall biosynthesis
MRLEKNPYKGSASNRPKSYIAKDILCCMLVYIPNFNGYFKDRFEVMKISLNSLILHTDKDIADILIFDQGSCGEVIDYLQDLKERGLITYFVQSTENLGYNGAKNFIYSMCQGEYLCWADDDVFFYPDWLTNSLKIAQTYPSVGIVSSSPISEKFAVNNSVAIDLPNTENEIQVIEGMWQESWDQNFNVSIGKMVIGSEDLHIPMYRYKGVDAIPVSSHFQYMITKKARQCIYPFKVGLAMSSSFEDPEFNMILALDKKLDDNGFAKLSTYGVFAEHLGGILTDRTLELATKYNVDISNVEKKTYISTTPNFIMVILIKSMNLPIIGTLPYRLYDFFFRLICEKKAYDKSKQSKKNNER